MEYMKTLLNKEKIKLEKNEEKIIELYEKLGNGEELKKVGKLALSLLGDLKGEYSLIQFVETKSLLTAWIGNHEKIEGYLETKKNLKKARETKKPYFRESSDEKDPNYFVILPIIAKDEVVGALCIHEEQEIINWRDIHFVTHFMSVAYKYYNLIEINKNIGIKDVVTRLFNYRHFQNQMDIEIEKSERYKVPLTLLMVDIHKFKLINDKLGNEAGDYVLKTLGTWIANTARKIDMPARLDADTFAILLSNTDTKGAEALLNRIMIKIENNPIKIENKEFYLKVKSSIVSFEKGMSKEQFLNDGKEQLKK